MSTTATSRVPFPESCALNTERLGLSYPREHDVISYIPGNPGISLDCTEVNSHLSSELETLVIDELYDWLWLVARKSGDSIDALHVQSIKGRTIIPCEDPRLHLVWHRAKVYIKPLPTYLLNHEFWQTYLCHPVDTRANTSDISPESGTPTTSRSIAIGFLRSYAFLIKHPIDFVLAKESHLIPHELNWISWSKFISNFRDIEDEQVAKRYHYGQLRLSRLHWIVRLLRPQRATTGWFYEVPYWSMIEYITRATVPLLFLFASVSIVLSSMQVMLSVPVDSLWFRHPDGLRYMGRAFWVYSIFVVVLSGVIWALLFCIPFIVLLRQLSWGFRKQWARARVEAKLKV